MTGRRFPPEPDDAADGEIEECAGCVGREVYWHARLRIYVHVQEPQVGCILHDGFRGHMPMAAAAALRAREATS